MEDHISITLVKHVIIIVIITQSTNDLGTITKGTTLR